MLTSFGILCQDTRGGEHAPWPNLRAIDRAGDDLCPIFSWCTALRSPLALSILCSLCHVQWEFSVVYAMSSCLFVQSCSQLCPCANVQCVSAVCVYSTEQPPLPCKCKGLRTHRQSINQSINLPGLSVLLSGSLGAGASVMSVHAVSICHILEL